MIDSTLDIIWEDEHLLVVNKPSGLLVHRGWGKEDVTLTDLVRAHTQGDKVYTVHRLDRATSGVIVFGQSADVVRALKVQFDAHTVRKRYLALVRGEAPARGLIDYAIRQKEKGDKRVDAVTAFRRLAYTEGTEPREVSLVEASPRSGRLHQIRRHLKHLNHPLINDANYGRGALNRAFRANYGLLRLGLHAFRLSFEHPGTGEPVSYVAPVASDFADALVRMGFEPEVWEGAVERNDAWDEAFEGEELFA